MDIRRDGDASVVATVRVDPMFQGPPGRVHGGIVAMLIDELMGAVNRMLGRRAFTARLAVDFRAAAPIDTELTLRAWLTTSRTARTTPPASIRSGSRHTSASSSTTRPVGRPQCARPAPTW
ncbi:MAG: PaaI family thioesterase [Ilumatobacteraceae bacterium]